MRSARGTRAPVLFSFSDKLARGWGRSDANKKHAPCVLRRLSDSVFLGTIHCKTILAFPTQGVFHRRGKGMRERVLWAPCPAHISDCRQPGGRARNPTRHTKNCNDFFDIDIFYIVLLRLSFGAQSVVGAASGARSYAQNGTGRSSEARSYAQNGTGRSSAARSYAQNGTGRSSDARSDAQNGTGRSSDARSYADNWTGR